MITVKVNFIPGQLLLAFAGFSYLIETPLAYFFFGLKQANLSKF